MNQDQVVAAIVVAGRVRAELTDDYVGIWKIPWHLRRQLPRAQDKVIDDLSEAVLAGLLADGAILGYIDSESGGFLAWPEDGSLEAAMRAWRALGRHPDIGEIAWLAQRI